MNMKLKLIIVTLFLLISFIAFTQNAFYGAQYLAKLDSQLVNDILSTNKFDLSRYEKRQLENLLIFLKTPFAKNLDNIDFKLIYDIFARWNSFIKMEFPTMNIGREVADSIGSYRKIASSISELIIGLSGFNTVQLDTILFGLTKYIAEEFKNAQVITYILTLENTFTKFPDLQILFPETTLKLKYLDPYAYSDFGTELKQVFYDDLRNMPKNLKNHIIKYNNDTKDYLIFNLETCKKLRSSRYFELFLLLSQIPDLVFVGNHPVEIFNYLDNKFYVENETTLGPLVHKLNLLQDNLRAKEENSYGNYGYSITWIKSEELKKLYTAKERIYFIALLNLQDKSFFEAGYKSLNISDLSRKSITDLLYDNFYSEFFNKEVYPFLDVLNQIDNFLQSREGKIGNEDLVIYLNLILDAITVFDIGLESGKYLSIIDNTLKIYNSLYLNDYSNMSFYIANLIDLFLADIDTGRGLEAKNKYLGLLNRYGSFMAAVVNAKNSQEVKQIIKNYVAPPSTFIDKRKYKFTVSVTSMPGYYASMEHLTGTIADDNWYFNSGMTLPIGFDFSRKLKFKNKISASLDVFIQVIDLGAMLNFTIINSQAKLPDEVKIEQIFSPGITINYGLKKSPLTIGAGWQYAPNLRKITLDGNTFRPNANRIFVRLAWDIPLINLYKTLD